MRTVRMMAAAAHTMGQTRRPVHAMALARLEVCVRVESCKNVQFLLLALLERPHSSVGRR